MRQSERWWWWYTPTTYATRLGGGGGGGVGLVSSVRRQASQAVVRFCRPMLAPMWRGGRETRVGTGDAAPAPGGCPSACSLPPVRQSCRPSVVVVVVVGVGACCFVCLCFGLGCAVRSHFSRGILLPCWPLLLVPYPPLRNLNCSLYTPLHAMAPLVVTTFLFVSLSVCVLYSVLFCNGAAAPGVARVASVDGTVVGFGLVALAIGCRAPVPTTCCDSTRLDSTAGFRPPSGLRLP